MMNVKVPCVQGYDKDQIAIVMDDPGMMEWLVILGASTLYCVMEVIKESEISKLAVPWASSRVSWLMRDIQAKLSQVVLNDVANKPIVPLHVDEVVRVTSKCTVPPFGHKAIHGKVNLVVHGYKMNVMTHGLEKRWPSLPLGIDVQMIYATLADGSNRVTVVLSANNLNLIMQCTNYAIYANCWKLVFSSSYAGCFLPCLLVLLFLRVRSLHLFLGNGCERLCALRPLLGSYIHQESI